jgi:hypothetical protein
MSPTALLLLGSWIVGGALAVWGGLRFALEYSAHRRHLSPGAVQFPYAFATGVAVASAPSVAVWLAG